MTENKITTSTSSTQNVDNQKNMQLTSTPKVLSKQDMLMGSLKTFFCVPEHLGKMIPILTQKSKISLRLLDWFVTNYAKKKNIAYFIDYEKNGEKKQKYFNVFLNYKSQLKAYSKQQFDPFCRKWKPHNGKRLYCGIHFYYKKDRYVETTVGQLNFFRWVVGNKVLDYAIEHLTDIQRDMLINANKSRSSKTSKSKSKTAKEESKKSRKSKNKQNMQPKELSETKEAKEEVEHTVVKSSSKGDIPPVSVNATKKLTKKHIKITVNFN